MEMDIMDIRRARLASSALLAQPQSTRTTGLKCPAQPQSTRTAGLKCPARLQGCPVLPPPPHTHTSKRAPASALLQGTSWQVPEQVP
jgi:hypothetical protein